MSTLGQEYHTMKNVYDFVSPLDFRYYGDDPYVFQRSQPYLSEAAYIKYQARVEHALIQAFFNLGWCPWHFADELLKACDSVTAEEVYEEEKRTSHVVRALVNCIARRVSPEAARFIHLFATSADITDTANALRFQEFVRDVLLPDLLDLLSTLINISRRYAASPQIGRTHGRHAEPITFGFATALYVDRMGGRIQLLETARNKLIGKLSGAVGAYNALSLQLPRAAVVFEKLVLSYLGLQPSQGSISSQIIQPEYLTDIGYAAHSCLSVLANLSDDIRHLHRSEIDEVQQQSRPETVGSSTMPHKVNPHNYENIKSLWKAFTPRITTLLMDQISEHQRDLTNSASQRFLPELFVALDYCAVRLNRSIGTLLIKEESMRRNLEMSKEHIVAEPLYIILVLMGYAGAYERVRMLAREARETGNRLIALAHQDPEIGPIIRNLRPAHAEILEDPAKYTGQSYERAVAVCDCWEAEGNSLRCYLQEEKEALSSIKGEYFQTMYKQILELESGNPAPKGFCPAENRKRFIESLIRESKMKEPA
jgi:adenylosuccinate lyase